MRIGKLKSKYGEVIVISEEKESNVYTRRKGFGDLIHQYGTFDDFEDAYELAYNLVDSNYFVWQGDCEGEPLLEEEELVLA